MDERPQRTLCWTLGEGDIVLPGGLLICLVKVFLQKKKKLKH